MQRYEAKWLDEGLVVCDRRLGGPKRMKATGKQGGGMGEVGRGTPGVHSAAAALPYADGRWHGLPLRMDLSYDGADPTMLEAAGHAVNRHVQDYSNGTRVVRWATHVQAFLPMGPATLKVQVQKGPRAYSLQVHASILVPDEALDDSSLEAIEAQHVQAVQEAVDAMLDGTGIVPLGPLYKTSRKVLEVARSAPDDAPVGGNVQRDGGAVDRSKDDQKATPVESEVSLPVWFAIKQEVKAQASVDDARLVTLEQDVALLKDGQDRMLSALEALSGAVLDRIDQHDAVIEAIVKRLA